MRRARDARRGGVLGWSISADPFGATVEDATVAVDPTGVALVNGIEAAFEEAACSR